MGLEHFNIVHVRLPVLHVAGVVTRHHPTVVVAPHHRPNGAIVRLKPINALPQQRCLSRIHKIMGFCYISLNKNIWW